MTAGRRVTRQALGGIAAAMALAMSLVEQRYALGDILGIVADPLDHAGDLQRRDHLAQFVLRRRAGGDDLDDLVPDLGRDRQARD